MIRLPVITLKKKNHRDDNQILLQFDYNEELIALTRTLPNAKWSQSLNSWYIKNTANNLKLIFSTYRGKAKINKLQFLKTTSEKVVVNKPKRIRTLSQENRNVLNNFFKFLKGKRYSKSTVNTYTFFIADFVEYHNNKDLSSLNNRDVERFIEDVFLKRNYSISTQRQFISAVKQFRLFYPDCKIDNLELTRPKKDSKLPNVLSHEEIIDLIGFTQNLKHRAVIALLYSCGLRISELINLELKEINVDRKQLLVRSSKGRKDRYVSLADSFLPLLSNYFFTYKPKKYFIEGQTGGKYSAESIRKFIKEVQN